MEGKKRVPPFLFLPFKIQAFQRLECVPSCVPQPHLLHPYQPLAAAGLARVEMCLFSPWVCTMVGSMLSLVYYFLPKFSQMLSFCQRTF